MASTGFSNNNNSGDGGNRSSSAAASSSKHHHQPNKNNNMLDYHRTAVALIFIVPALGGFLYGYDIGATSFAILQLSSSPSSSSSDDDYTIRSNIAGVSFTLANSPILTGLVVAIPNIGAFFGTTIVFAIAEIIGRRMELRVGAILYLLGTILVVSVPYLDSIIFMGSTGTTTDGAINGRPPDSTNDDIMTNTNTSLAAILSLTILLLGRLLYGMGIGFVMHGGPTDLGEMLPPSIRGLLISLTEVAIVVGMLMGYGIGYVLMGTYRGWAHSYGCTVPISATMYVLSYWIPYSARWLFSRGRDGEALDALLFEWSPNSAKEEYEQLLFARRKATTRNVPTSSTNTLEREHRQEEGRWQPLQQETAAGGVNSSHISASATTGGGTTGNNDDGSGGLFDPTRRAALTAGIGLVALQQVTGQPSVLSYFTIIASTAGLSTYSSVLVAYFRVVAAFIAVLLVERQGRRKLLLIGCILMFIALSTLTVTFHSNYDDDDTNDDSGGGAGRQSDNDNDGITSTDTSSPPYGHNYVGGLDVRSFITLVAMFVYFGGYQIGFGPITLLLTSEVFPQAVRGKAVALAVQTNFFLNGLVQFAVPILQTHLGLSMTFGIFTVLMVYSIYFIYRYVPETKGLTLEEIEENFTVLTETTTRTTRKSNQTTGIVDNYNTMVTTTSKDNSNNNGHEQQQKQDVNVDERVQLIRRNGPGGALS